MQRAVVIVAGGVGSRMNADIPKQFIAVNKKPLIVYTIAAFVEIEDFNFSEFVIVCHQDYIKQLEDILSTYFKDINFILVAGGKSRFQSCFKGLKAIAARDNKLVAIHDAARPLISKQLIKSVFEAAQIHQTAIPVINFKDSVRLIVEGTNDSKIVDRSRLRLVQTPQCFNHTKLLQAYENAINSNEHNFTDDASVWEALHHQVFLCEGEANNIKVTTPFDLKLVEVLLQL